MPSTAEQYDELIKQLNEVFLKRETRRRVLVSALEQAARIPGSEPIRKRIEATERDVSRLSDRLIEIHQSIRELRVLDPTLADPTAKEPPQLRLLREGLARWYRETGRLRDALRRARTDEEQDVLARQVERADDRVEFFVQGIRAAEFEQLGLSPVLSNTRADEDRPDPERPE